MQVFCISNCTDACVCICVMTALPPIILTVGFVTVWSYWGRCNSLQLPCLEARLVQLLAVSTTIT
jgi:hypothetical protein